MAPYWLYTWLHHSLLLQRLFYIAKVNIGQGVTCFFSGTFYFGCSAYTDRTIFTGWPCECILLYSNHVLRCPSQSEPDLGIED